MDLELKSKSPSRGLDYFVESSEDDEDGFRSNDVDDEVLEGAHVLHNVLRSLEASAGAPGPTANLLNEMGDVSS